MVGACGASDESPANSSRDFHQTRAAVPANGRFGRLETILVEMSVKARNEVQESWEY